VRTELEGLRRALASASIGRIEPHLTLVPPRNVAADGQALLGGLLRTAAAASGPLRLVLGPAATFAPRNPAVYLAVGGELEALAALRRALETGPLAPPEGRGERPFVPHVTLSGSVPPERAAAAAELIAAYRCEVVVERVHLLVQDETAPRRPWLAVADATLGRPAVLGRGGRELELRLAGGLDPEERAFFEAEWLAYSRQAYGPDFAPDEPLAVVARAAGRIVAVATGSLRPDVLELSRLIVAADERGSGVGAAVMGFVERLAVERRAGRVRLKTRAGGPAEAFYRRLGYEVVAMLPRWREGHDFAVMERRLPVPGR